MRNTYNRVFYGFPFKKKIDRKKKRKRRFEIREEVEEKERKKEEKRERKRIRKMDKRDFLLAINLMVMFVGYSCYSSVIPFLALTMEQECGLTPFLVGMVMAAYPLGMVVSSLITGQVQDSIGAKVIVISSIFGSAISLVIFGLIPEVFCHSDTDGSFFEGMSRFGGESRIGAIVAFIGLRFVAGLCGGAMETSILTTNAVLFTDCFGKVVAYQETVVGVAIMLGPVLGGVLYNLIGFFYAFVVFACLQSCLGVCVIFVLPSGKEIQEMKEKERKKEGDFGREGRETDPLLEKKSTIQIEGESQEKGNDDVTFSQMFSLPLFMSLFVVSAGNFIFSLPLSFLPLYLYDQFGWGPMLSGIAIMGLAMAFTISSLVVGHTLDKEKHPTTGNFKLYYGGGFAIMALGTWLMGPFPLTEMIRPSIVFLGISLLGVGTSFASTPSLPDLQYCGEKKLGRESVQAKSILSGVWTSACSLTEIFAGAVGGALYGQIGFLGLCMFSSLGCLIFSVICLFYGFSLNYHPFWSKS